MTSAVLTKILASGQVTDGATRLPLLHPDVPGLRSAIDAGEGAWLQRLVADVKPQRSIEIGCAYGVSSLFICDALAALPHPVTHIVIDPYQSTTWRGIGRRNLDEAGFGALVDFHEAPSELALPSLLAAGTRVDFAFVDGRHTFDQVVTEFYYLNRMLRIGGVIAFDDADRVSVNRAIRHALTYPAYRAYGAAPGADTRSTMLGRCRRAVGRLPFVADLLRADFVERDWDLGIFGSCVAIQKVAEDARTSGWDARF